MVLRRALIPCLKPLCRRLINSRQCVWPRRPPRCRLQRNTVFSFSAVLPSLKLHFPHGHVFFLMRRPVCRNFRVLFASPCAAWANSCINEPQVCRVFPGSSTYHHPLCEYGQALAVGQWNKVGKARRLSSPLRQRLGRKPTSWCIGGLY